jgi:membrane-bound lytic murein transglycosylase F
MPETGSTRGWRTARHLVAALCLLATACNPSKETKLDAVKHAGELVVLTRNSPTTFYEGPDGPAGFEYDLAHAFAERLGVTLRMKTVDHFRDVLPMVADGQGDFAAAGITVTPLRETEIRFTPSYQTIRQQVVCNLTTAPPANVEGLIGRHLEVASGTSYVELLNQLKLVYPALSWTVIENVETEDLLAQVEQGLIELTVADSNIVDLSRQFNPDLRVAFDLGEPEKLAWAFPLSDDDSLFQAASQFLEDMRASGALAQLIERHYGAASRLNPFNVAVYTEKIRTDLPRYQQIFKKAGRRYALDWRLLAAISYQESYWNPEAVSPTGVRGIMMLTETTAQHLGIADRMDAHQSINGGAAYLRTLIDRIPEHIPEPDRTWFALAAYNVGINHLEDARILTQVQDGDPDRWADVKTRLPLLSKPAWYTKTKHGYARGYEPVQFVNRVRSYYEILRRADAANRARNRSDALRLRAPAL